MKEFIRAIKCVILPFIFYVISITFLSLITFSSLKLHNDKEEKSTISQNNLDIVDDNVNSSSRKTVTISDNSIAIQGKYNVIIPNEVEEEQINIELDKIRKSEDIKKIVIDEIEALRNGEAATVYKWYGVSDIFTPEFISMTSSRVVVNFTESELEAGRVGLHLCVIQNDMVEQAMREMAEQGIEATEISNKAAERMIDGEFNSCYNVVVSVGYDGIIPTEEIKVIMSGCSYNTVDVEPVECSIKHEKEELEYE